MVDWIGRAMQALGGVLRYTDGRFSFWEVCRGPWQVGIRCARLWVWAEAEFLGEGDSHPHSVVRGFLRRRSDYESLWAKRIEVAMSKFLRGLRDSNTTKESASPPLDESFRQRFPCLFDMVSVRVLDKKPRETSTLFVFIEDGHWKVCLCDRDLGRVAFVSSESLDGLWESLEAGLASGSLDWRQDRKKSRKG